MIFDFSSKGEFKKIKRREAITTYILPSMLRSSYEKEKETISLMDLELSDEVCSEILKVGTIKQKEIVKNLFLADNKLTKLPFNPAEFPTV